MQSADGIDWSTDRIDLARHQEKEGDLVDLVNFFVEETIIAIGPLFSRNISRRKHEGQNTQAEEGINMQLRQ